MNSPFNADQFKDLINKDTRDDLPKDDFPDVDSASNHKVKMVSIKDIQDVEYEEVKSKIDSDLSFMKSMPEIPKELSDVNKDNKLVISTRDSYNELFEELNAKYGFSIKFDNDSFKDSFIQIIDGRSKRAIDLYLSESYSRFKSITMLQYLQAISILSAQVLNPAFIQSESLSYQDRFDILDKLYNLVEKVVKISEAIEIKDSEMKLEKLVEEGESSLERQSPEVTNFLEALSQSIRDSNKSE